MWKSAVLLVCFAAFGISSVAKDAQPIVIAFLGDSLTEGYGIAPNAAYPALVEKALKKNGRMIKVINSGISGSTSASAPSRMKWLLKAKPDWVVLALGANDGLRGLSLDEMEKNLTKTIDMAEQANVRILLAGMKVPPNLGAEYGQRFEKAFRDIAETHKKVVFLPFLLEGVGGHKKFNQADGIHPNEKGHEIMAETVLKVLEPHL